MHVQIFYVLFHSNLDQSNGFLCNKTIGTVSGTLTNMMQKVWNHKNISKVVYFNGFLGLTSHLFCLNKVMRLYLIISA